MRSSFGWEGKGRYAGCASKTVRSLENTCHTWAPYRWSRRGAIQIHVYLLPYLTCLVDWRIDSLIDALIHWFIEWFIYSLINWFNNSLMDWLSMIDYFSPDSCCQPNCDRLRASIPFYFSLSSIGFTYFLLLSIPSLSTRIVPLLFQAGGRRRRPNLGLVCVLFCN